MSKQVVHIIDDDGEIRDSIKELVESVGLIAATFDSALCALSALTPETAGCVVLDIRMSGMSGFGLQKQLSNRGIGIPLFFITGYGDIDTAVKAIKQGAIDFIQKPFHEQTLLESIYAALDLDAHKKQQFYQSKKFNVLSKKLTNREEEVLEQLLKGLSNKLIARFLGISHRTVEVHRQHIFQKFEVHSASQLMYQIK